MCLRSAGASASMPATNAALGEVDIAALALAENALTEAIPVEITEQIVEVCDAMAKRLDRIEMMLEGGDDDAGRQDKRGGRLPASVARGVMPASLRVAGGSVKNRLGEGSRWAGGWKGPKRGISPSAQPANHRPAANAKGLLHFGTHCELAPQTSPTPQSRSRLQPAGGCGGSSTT